MTACKLLAAAVSWLFLTHVLSGMASFPKSVSKTAVSSSKAPQSQVPDVEPATRCAEPEPCFDPAITKAVAIVAASSCTPHNLLSQCFPSSSVAGVRTIALALNAVQIMSSNNVMHVFSSFTDFRCPKPGGLNGHERFVRHPLLQRRRGFLSSCASIFPRLRI